MQRFLRAPQKYPFPRLVMVVCGFNAVGRVSACTVIIGGIFKALYTVANMVASAMRLWLVYCVDYSIFLTFCNGRDNNGN